MLKVFLTRLLLILEVYNAKPTPTKYWARNLLMLDLTFGPSFDELYFRWIQICVGSPMRRSSYIELWFSVRYADAAQRDFRH